MKEVYKKLIKHLTSMTPEEKGKEWEELKKYNEIGPEVEEILKKNKTIWNEKLTKYLIFLEQK